MKKILLQGFLSFIFICIIIVLSETIFFTRSILGDLRISHSFQHEFKMHIGRDGKNIIGYAGSEAGWYIQGNYAYGVLEKVDDNEKSKEDEKDETLTLPSLPSLSDIFIYFIFDCKTNEVQFFPYDSEGEKIFKSVLQQKNLPWKRFTMMSEVEEWLAVKTNKRKFSNVCPME